MAMAADGIYGEEGFSTICSLLAPLCLCYHSAEPGMAYGFCLRVGGSALVLTSGTLAGREVATRLVTVRKAELEFDVCGITCGRQLKTVLLTTLFLIPHLF